MPRPIAPSLSVISASTVGRPRESQMRRATSDWMTGSLIALGSHASATSIRRARRIGDQRRGASAHGGALALAGEVFDRRLAVDPGEEQSRQQRGRARFELVRALPIDASEIGASQRRKGGVVARPVGALARALKQEMIETEGEIEGGIAEPGAFGVEEHRPARGLAGCSWG